VAVPELTVTTSADPGPDRLALWDALVASAPAGDVAQLSGWAVLRGEAGFAPLYVLAVRGSDVVGGALVLCRRLPVGGRVGYVSYGPLVGDHLDGDDRAEVLREVCAALERVGRERTRMLFVQPPEGADEVSRTLLRDHGFRCSDAGVAPAASLRVDLSVTEAELRRGLSRRLRTWTNQWPARGVKVRQGTGDDLPMLAELLADTARHQGFTPFSPTYLQVLHRELVEPGRAAVFVGEVDGRAVAADVLTVCGDSVKVRFVGLDRSSAAAHLNVPGAIRWESMRWARDHGLRWFDFGGLQQASVEALFSGGEVDVEALAGPDRYKVKFGGAPFRYPAAVELVPNVVVRGGYDLLRRSPRGRLLLDDVKRRIRGGAAALGGRAAPAGPPAPEPAVTVQRAADPGPDAVAEWDRLVAAARGTDVTQLSVWSRVRERQRFTPLYLLARRGDALVGGALVLTRRIRGIGRVGYVSYGPVVADEGGSRTEVVEALVDALAALRGVAMLFVQPPEGAEDVSHGLLARGFRASAAQIAPSGSMRIDLHREEAELRASLSRRLRYWTTRWADRGVTVRRGDERDVPLLAELMHTAARARGYARPPRPEYLSTLYAELARTGNVALFVGEVHGVPVTADLVTLCGDTVRGKLCGFDRDGDGRRLSVPAAARWEIIRWARRSGYRWMDFGGLSEVTLHGAIDRGARDDAGWPSADRAKMAFGGTAFRYPCPVERVRPVPLRLAYGLARRSRFGRFLIARARITLRSSADRPLPGPSPTRGR
jgi:lipid II:glycine glycyltransferase (peptidoglycan interpeptide bridge formation enzyme)